MTHVLFQLIFIHDSTHSHLQFEKIINDFWIENVLVNSK